MILGTVGYMAPEQASGKPADFRSDQFSLGAILYEMVSSVKPFARPTPLESLTAIVKEEPPLMAISPATPEPLRWIIERCLAKEPEGRYASTRDLARPYVSIPFAAAIAARAPDFSRIALVLARSALGSCRTAAMYRPCCW